MTRLAERLAALQGLFIGTCIQWREAGAIEQLMSVLQRTSAGTSEKKAKWTTLIIIDFGCGTKYLQCGCVETKGFCSYKSTNGIKRHLAVDTLGFPFFTHCSPANVTDDAGLLEMLTRSHRLFPVETCEYSAILPFCSITVIAQTT